jgi:hypothetical protein
VVIEALDSVTAQAQDAAVTGGFYLPGHFPEALGEASELMLGQVMGKALGEALGPGLKEALDQVFLVLTIVLPPPHHARR